jgi:hypothetical protein
MRLERRAPSFPRRRARLPLGRRVALTAARPSTLGKFFCAFTENAAVIIIHAMEFLTNGERKGRWSALAALGVGFAVTFFLDPVAPLGGAKVCGFLRLTGLPCPTCGITRAVCCISHGMFEESLYFNYMGCVVYATGLIVGAVMATELATGRKFKWYRPRRAWWLVALCVGTALTVWVVKIFETMKENPRWARESLVYRVFQ